MNRTVAVRDKHGTRSSSVDRAASIGAPAAAHAAAANSGGSDRMHKRRRHRCGRTSRGHAQLGPQRFRVHAPPSILRPHGPSSRRTVGAAGSGQPGGAAGVAWSVELAAIGGSLAAFVRGARDREASALASSRSQARPERRVEPRDRGTSGPHASAPRHARARDDNAGPYERR
jgi:hypothetical protein